MYISLKLKAVRVQFRLIKNCAGPADERREEKRRKRMRVMESGEKQKKRQKEETMHLPFPHHSVMTDACFMGSWNRYAKREMFPQIWSL